MRTYHNNQVQSLHQKAIQIVNIFSATECDEKLSSIVIPEDYQKEFFNLIDNVNLSLMEDNDNFYGYFLFQMAREIRFDISSPTAVNFKGAKYVIYFNPLMFLKLSIKQMESSIKHEILHILSLHLIRAKEFKDTYSPLAINMAMDIVVNTYLHHLPPYAITLEWVKLNYFLCLEPYATFEHYVEKLQEAIDLQLDNSELTEDDSDKKIMIQSEYDAARTHDLWNVSNDIVDRTLKEFTKKAIDLAEKGEIPVFIKNMISAIKNNESEIPWNLYLKRLLGTIESNKKKTITRRNRRQPDRLDLRGELRSHKANIAVAIDISGSISDEEFTQAIKEVLSIVKNYNHEITIIECDDQIRSSYKASSVKDLKERSNTRGSTAYSPVIDYANHNKINLLVYFTDGKGEARLKIPPRGYPILWIISGRGDMLSLKEPYGAVKKLSYIETKETVVDFSEASNGGYSMQHHERLL